MHKKECANIYKIKMHKYSTEYAYQKCAQFKHEKKDANKRMHQNIIYYYIVVILTNCIVFLNIFC